MYCRTCGKQIDDNSRFCAHCGKPVGKQASRDLAQPPTPNGTHIQHRLTIVRKPNYTGIRLVDVMYWYGDKLVCGIPSGRQITFCYPPGSHTIKFSFMKHQLTMVPINLDRDMYVVIWVNAWNARLSGYISDTPYVPEKLTFGTIKEELTNWFQSLDE